MKWSLSVLNQTEKQAKFIELVEFIRNESDEANSSYGKALYTAAATMTPTIKSSVKRTSAFGTSTSSNSKQKTISDTGKNEQCFHCQKHHHLEKYEDFQRLERYKTGVDNLRPAGQIRPADTFYPARSLFPKLCIYLAHHLFK